MKIKRLNCYYYETSTIKICYLQIEKLIHFHKENEVFGVLSSSVASPQAIGRKLLMRQSLIGLKSESLLIGSAFGTVGGNLQRAMPESEFYFFYANRRRIRRRGWLVYMLSFCQRLPVFFVQTFCFHFSFSPIISILFLFCLGYVCTIY